MTEPSTRKTLAVCVAGATGWTGGAVVRAILGAGDFALSGAVARTAAGQDAGTALGVEPAGVTVSATVAEALEAPADVFIDYSATAVVKGHVLHAIDRGVATVIGTSGLTGADYDEIGDRARERGVGVIASGNFSLTAALLQHLALIAARHVPQWEVMDYASATKQDVPSGTARELAEKLAQVRRPEIGRPVDSLHGPKESRGADIDGVQVHSVRLPGFVLACEAVFGLAGERLSLRHEAGASAEPYVAGTLIAARRAVEADELVRGLDRVLFGGD